MRLRMHVAFGLLATAGACSASGTVDDPRPDAGESRADAAGPDVDAGPAEDATADVALPSDRPLACGDAGYCETRLPTSELGLPLSLRGVWVVAPNDVWSVTLEGVVLHHDGASWSVAYKTHHALTAVWATATSVWVGGESGLLFHRNAAGEWSLVESGHAAPIRAISGTGDGDVWFTSHGSAVDHWGGTKLTHHPIDVPGLRIMTVFARPGFGAYAAGYVPGTQVPFEEMDEYVAYKRPDQPHVFKVSPNGIEVFSSSLTELRGVVPVTGVVTDSSDEDQRIFIMGYTEARSRSGDDRYEWSDPKVGSFGMRSPVSFTSVYSYLGMLLDAQGVALPVPALDYETEGLRIPFTPATMYRWNGSRVTREGLKMGGDVSAKPVFGAHNDREQTWMVGDGFALKGANP
jgi:hypothetical protein